jgi:dTDP-4-amino-4,6-dideoxygalactose transaminase
MSEYQIPFNKPFIAGKELYHVAQSVLGGHSSGDGPYGKKCQALLRDLLQVDHALMTTSCSAALDMAALVCDIGEGNEVILPSFTAAGTANAFLNRGVKLIFCDISPDTLTMDVASVANLLGPRTRAIVPRHYAGVSPDMDALTELARKHDVWVIEDAAEAFNAHYKGRPLGTIGDIGVFSFHETKNFSCGEGGAFITSDQKLFERGEIIREKGTNRSQFFRGQVDKYTWVEIGSSYVPSDLLMAFLYGQLEQLEEVTSKRRALFLHYLELFRPLADEGLLMLPAVPKECDSNFHRFHILLRSKRERIGLQNSLRDHSILAVPHFFPLHLSSMGKRMGWDVGALPVTEDIHERILRMPFFYELTAESVAEVCNRIFQYFGLPTPRSALIDSMSIGR